MPQFSKPEGLNIVWASNALDIDILRPSDDEIREGWIQEKPPYEVENWSMRKLHQAIAHINQMGISVWDDKTEYQVGSLVRSKGDGKLYECTQFNTNRNPDGGANAEYWEEFKGARTATTERIGLVELATIEEVAAGVRNDVVVTPHTLGEGYVGNPVGTVLTFAGGNAPAGYMECNGRTLNVVDYPELFAVIGYTYGGSGATFRIPDTRGEFIRGWDHGRGVDGGRTLGSVQIGAIESHNHSGNTNYDGTHSHSASTNNAGYHNHSGSTHGAGGHNHTGNTNTTGNHNHKIPEGTTNDYGSSIYASGDDETDRVFRWSDSQYAGNHYHSFTTSWQGDHSHSLAINHNGTHSHSVSVSSSGNHNHSFATNYTGGGETRPRNIAMMYCIKYE